MAVRAANDDVYACCSTLGPDRYSDGTPVADGEAYALVYTKPGAAFAGFRADGALVDPGSSEVALVLPMAKEGRCHPTLCVLPKTFAARRTTGTWELVLLDTRRADGTPAGADADGALTRVRSWGATASFVDFRTGGFSFQSASPSTAAGSGASDADGAVASTLSVLPSGLAPPRITGMAIEGETVSLTVADTRPYLTYDVKGVTDLSSSSPARVARAKLDGRADGELVIQADGARANFFSVVVDR